MIDAHRRRRADIPVVLEKAAFGIHHVHLALTPSHWIDKGGHSDIDDARDAK